MTLKIVTNRATLDDELTDAINEFLRTPGTVGHGPVIVDGAFAALVNVGHMDSETFPRLRKGCVQRCGVLMDWAAELTGVEAEGSPGWFWVSYAVSQVP